MERPLGSSYFIGDLIGRGGMGQVFRGRDMQGNAYAIKLLNADLATDPTVVSRFVQERVILTRLRHPNLVRVHDLVVEGDTLAIVMELVDGTDLRRALAAVGTFPPAEVARLGAAVTEGIAAAHDHGVVHRDIKPENILLDSTRSPSHPLVSDFGVARLIDARTMAHGTEIIGTPRYMAPELLAGRPPTPATDLYALGVVLYELCCGTAPFVGSFGQVTWGHVDLLPGRPAGIPDPLWDLIDRLLAKAPEDRPTSAHGTATRLDLLASVLGGYPAAVPIASPPPGVPTPSRLGLGATYSTGLPAVLPTVLLAGGGPATPWASGADVAVTSAAAGGRPTSGLAVANVPRRRRRGALVVGGIGLGIALTTGAVAVALSSGGGGDADGPGARSSAAPATGDGLAATEKADFARGGVFAPPGGDVSGTGTTDPIEPDDGLTADEARAELAQALTLSSADEGSTDGVWVPQVGPVCAGLVEADLGGSDGFGHPDSVREKYGSTGVGEVRVAQYVRAVQEKFEVVLVHHQSAATSCRGSQLFANVAQNERFRSEEDVVTWCADHVTVASRYLPCQPRFVLASSLPGDEGVQPITPTPTPTPTATPDPDRTATPTPSPSPSPTPEAGTPTPTPTATPDSDPTPTPDDPTPAPEPPDPAADQT